MVIMRSTEDNQRDQRCWDKVASFRYTYRLARDVRGTDSIDRQPLSKAPGSLRKPSSQQTTTAAMIRGGAPGEPSHFHHVIAIDQLRTFKLILEVASLIVFVAVAVETTVVSRPVHEVIKVITVLADGLIFCEARH